MISFELKAAWAKKHLERKFWGFLFGFIFLRMEIKLHFLRHLAINSRGVLDLWIAYMKKLILTPVTKNFEVWANLWMLASLASQIPILSFGVASAWIGIFLIPLLSSLIRKILSTPSQFFITWVKNRYSRILTNLYDSILVQIFIFF